MPRSKTTISELRVGLLAVATIVILIVFILSVTGDIALFKSTRTYTTHLNAAEGLKSGDEVRLAGKRVGKVESVDFQSQVPTDANAKPIVVTMTVDPGEVDGFIRGDSQAVLAQQGFLGDRVIDITPGTQGYEPLPNGADIKSADVAGLAQVFGGANDVLVQFNVVGQQLQQLVKDINEGKGTIGQLLHDDALYVNLNRTVVDAQGLVRRIQQGDGTIPKLLNDPTLYNDLRGATNELQVIAADLRAGKGTAGKLLNDERLYQQAAEAVTKANDMIAKFDRITADIEAGRGTLGKFVKEEKFYNDLEATLANLRTISDNLQQGQGTAGQLLHDEKLYNNVNQMSTEVVKLLYDFRQNPRKYLSVKVSLF